MEDRYLFKAKRIKDAQWIEGYLIYSFTGVPFIITEYDHILALVARDEIDTETICQCTGLKDKNGKLIWENDIIKAWSQGTCAKGKIKQRIDGTWIMYPAWQKGEMWYLCPDNNGETTVEVIGNIFDNPELLEVQE